MEPARAVREIWNWLPAFRAVAETEHLPSAARALHVGPSSLSRAVALLEDHVGRPLFRRVGRRIVLDEAGRELLSAVRLAMRSVHEALVRIDPAHLVGPVRISVQGPYAPIYVLPVLDELAREHPALLPEVSSRPFEAIPADLNTGRLDLALVDGHAPGEGLVVRRLATVPHAVCCAPDHPLVRVPCLDPETVGRHRFAVPIPRPDGSIPDRWPPQWPRRIGLRVAQMQVAVEACRDHGFLAVLPWPVARRAGLCRLSLSGIGASDLLLLHRPSLDRPTRTERIADALASWAAGVATD